MSAIMSKENFNNSHTEVASYIKNKLLRKNGGLSL